MLNLKYLSNVFLYFFSFSNLGYIFIIGFCYLIQDYFILLLSYYKDFYFLGFLEKENLKFLLLFLIFVSCLF